MPHGDELADLALEEIRQGMASLRANRDLLGRLDERVKTLEAANDRIQAAILKAAVAGVGSGALAGVAAGLLA